MKYIFIYGRFLICLYMYSISSWTSNQVWAIVSAGHFYRSSY